MKRMLLCLLLGILLVLLVSSAALADFFTSDGFTYTLDAEGATITGYKGDAVSATIPAQVYQDTPYQVKRIQSNAFANMGSETKLRELTISEGIEEIGNQAFEECRSLQVIKIPDSVTQIGAGAFKHCKSLTEIHIPSKLSYLGDAAFYECTKLTGKLTLPGTLTNVGKQVFTETKFTELELDPSFFQTLKAETYFAAKGVFGYLFENKDSYSVTKVTLKGTGAIPAYFLRNCSGLKTGALEGSFTAIGKNAFEGCAGLESLSIPDTVTTIGNNAFTGCTGLSQIQLPLSVAQSAEGLGLMITPEVVFPADFFAGYELPQGIETIEDSAFEGAAWEMVALPATCQTVGSRAFANNRALKYLYVPDSVQTIAGDAFVGCDQLYLVGSGNTVKTYADKYLDGRCYLQH